MIVVRYTAAADAGARAAARRAAGATSARSIAHVRRAEALRLAPGERPSAAASRVAGRPGVAWAEPVLRWHAAAVPDDPRFAAQWALRNTGQRVVDTAGTAGADINAASAWDLETGARRVLVAVADTGVAVDQPDLAPNVWANPGESGAGRETNGVDDDGDGLVDDVHGWDWVQGDNAPYDLNGHGTHVAGIIGARGNDGFGTAGVDWSPSLLPLRVLDEVGAGSSIDIAAAFAYAARQGAKVVNASLGGGYSHLIDDVIRLNPQTLFVVAAGNDGADEAASPMYPCALPYDNVVCVAATDQSDALAQFSNYGAAVDIAAPGTDVVAPQPALRTVFSDDFESDSDPLLADFNFRGAWARTTAHASSGTHGLAPPPDADYGAGAEYASRTPYLDLTGLSGCRVDFRQWIHVVDRYSSFALDGTDEGTGNIDTVGPFDSTNAPPPGTWIHTLMPDLTGSLAGLRIGFWSYGDGAGQSATIDDLHLRCVDPAATPGADSFDTFSGTSMATPFVTGAAALLWSRNPGLSVAEVRDALLGGARRLRSLQGRVASGRLDVRAALDRVAAAPAGGGGSEPPTGGDPGGGSQPGGGGEPGGGSEVASGGQPGGGSDPAGGGQLGGSSQVGTTSRPAGGAQGAGGSATGDAHSTSRPRLTAHTVAMRLPGTLAARSLDLRASSVLSPRFARVTVRCTGRGCARALVVLAPGSARSSPGPVVARRLGRAGRALPRAARLLITVRWRDEAVRLVVAYGHGRWLVRRTCRTPAGTYSRCGA